MNFLTYFLFIFYLLSFSQPSKSNVWVKDIKSNFFQFTAHLTSLDSTHLSYGEYLLKLKRKETKKFQLKELILKAQEYYLSGEIDLALEVFKEITSLGHSADWNEEQRRVIFYSFLRRSQNEKDVDKKQALLLSAAQFIVFKITKDYLDYHLFPPPLLEKLKQIQNQQSFLSLSLKTLFPHHEIILINGKQISNDRKKIQIPESSYRITALSSSHTPWTKIVPISYLMTQSIKTSSLTSGYCKTLKMRNNLVKKTIKIFYNKNCEKNNYLEKKKNQGELSDKILNNNKYIKFNFFKKKLPAWLIVGTVILTTGIVLSFTMDDKGKTSSSKVFF